MAGAEGIARRRPVEAEDVGGTTEGGEAFGECERAAGEERVAGQFAQQLRGRRTAGALPVFGHRPGRGGAEGGTGGIFSN